MAAIFLIFAELSAFLAVLLTTLSIVTPFVIFRSIQNYKRHRKIRSFITPILAVLALGFILQFGAAVGYLGIMIYAFRGATFEALYVAITLAALWHYFKPPETPKSRDRKVTIVLAAAAISVMFLQTITPMHFGKFSIDIDAQMTSPDGEIEVSLNKPVFFRPAMVDLEFSTKKPEGVRNFKHVGSNKIIHRTGFILPVGTTKLRIPLQTMSCYQQGNEIYSRSPSWRSMRSPDSYSNYSDACPILPGDYSVVATIRLHNSTSLASALLGRNAVKNPKSSPSSIRVVGELNQSAQVKILRDIASAAENEVLDHIQIKVDNEASYRNFRLIEADSLQIEDQQFCSELRIKGAAEHEFKACVPRHGIATYSTSNLTLSLIQSATPQSANDPRMATQRISSAVGLPDEEQRLDFALVKRVAGSGEAKAWVIRVSGDFAHPESYTRLNTKAIVLDDGGLCIFNPIPIEHREENTRCLQSLDDWKYFGN